MVTALPPSGRQSPEVPSLNLASLKIPFQSHKVWGTQSSVAVRVQLSLKTEREGVYTQARVNLTCQTLF